MQVVFYYNIQVQVGIKPSPYLHLSFMQIVSINAIKNSEFWHKYNTILKMYMSGSSKFS